jgi:pSer/pThr/pTyr-binding forkhead associated (FHA) protein
VSDALPKVRFTHKRGSRTGEVQLLHQEHIRLGRRPDNDVVFDVDADRACSGYHCELFFRGGEFHVRDVGSSNGTFVNGERVTSPVPLRTGDEVGLGSEGPLMAVDIGENIGGTMRMDSGEVDAVKPRKATAGGPFPSTTPSRKTEPRASRSALREAGMRVLVVLALAAALLVAWKLALG